MIEFTKLLKNVEKLQELGFNSEFDISPFLLPVDDVIKKILKQKNPKFSAIEIDLIVDSEDISLSKSIAKIDEEFKKKRSSNLNLTPEEKKARKEQLNTEKERRKQAATEQVKQIKNIYKDKIVELKSEAKKTIKEIKIGSYNFIRETKTIVKKSTTSLIQAGSSLGAISVIIAAPPWNIPLAISYTMSIVDILLSLVSQLKNIISYTVVFEKLNLIVDSKNLSILSIIFNSFMNIILGIWSKLTGIESLVKKLLDFIIKLISGANKQKIFKKVTSKLRKLGNFKDENKTFVIDGVSVRANSEDDAIEVKDFLETYKVDYGKKKVSDYKNNSDSSINPEQLLTQLSNDINRTQEIEIPSEVEDSYINLYEVKLPNGTILINQTEKDLEDLQSAYNLVIQKIDNITVDQT
jgi:hypothetical protein